jgi:hypothetical protein
MSDCDLDSTVADWVFEHPEPLVGFQPLAIDTRCGGKSPGFARHEQIKKQFLTFDWAPEAMIVDMKNLEGKTLDQVEVEEVLRR